MKKLGKRHDEIVHWLFNKPEEILGYLDIVKPYIMVEKEKEIPIFDSNKKIGYFDVVLTVSKDDHVSVFNFVVNVKLESATLQLREINELSAVHMANLRKIPGAIMEQNFIIVSENNEFESFFTDEGYSFYKY
jgi:hypothetical protein